MANLLLSSASWTDGNSLHPPAIWNGTLYDFTGFSQANCTITATASAGDVIEYDLNNLSSSHSPQGLRVFVNGSQVHQYDLSVIGTEHYLSSALNNGDTVQIAADVQDIGFYVVDFTLTPTGSPPPSPVAPDESLSVAKNSQNNPVTPVITESGAPITDYTLGIVSQPANGTASVSDQTLLYTPSANYTGSDAFTYNANDGTNDSNTATVTIVVQAVPPCEELGRTTRTYVSGYTLSRQAVTRVRRSAQRCVVANFNGAIPKSRTIQSVRWETTSPWSIVMSNPRIATGQRETMVDVFFNFAGWGGLLATVTLDNGEIYNAEFSFTVLDAPLYPTATYPLGNGPYRLDATV